MHAQLLSQVQLFGTPWATTCQAPLSMEFSRQEYGSGLPFIPPGGLPNPGMERTSPVSPALQAGSLPQSRLGSPRVPSPLMFIHGMTQQMAASLGGWKAP